ncbi:MAG: class I SAM-dependent methyltransferase [bacterium]|nr:class I SAM-dependent methyltransferase [bacterium]
MPVACDLCGTDQPLTLAHRDKYGFLVPSVVCTRCGLLYLNPRPTPEAYAEFYVAEYRTLVMAEKNLNARYQAQRGHGEFILDFCRDLLQDPKRVLDIGCDVGGILHVVSEALGCDAYGVEPDQEAAAYAQEKVGRSPIFAGNFEEAPLEAVTFDFIILTQTLNHLLSPTDALEKIRSLLSPRGVAFIEVYNVMATASWSNITDHAKVDHPYMFGAATFRALLGKVGLTILRFAEDTFEDTLRKERLKLPGAHAHLRAAVCLGPRSDPKTLSGYREVRTLLRRSALRMAAPRLLRRLLGERVTAILRRLVGERGHAMLHRFASGRRREPRRINS